MRSVGGEFVLRIEDVDTARSRSQYTSQILFDLRWLGLDWDEGPDFGGAYGPYEQSKRRELYEEALAVLKRRGFLYPCFCSRLQLQKVAQAPHGLSAEGPVYPGTCRTLSPEQRRRRAKQKTPSLRFAMTNTGGTPRAVEEFAVEEFLDLAAGPQAFAVDAGGDFVVKRADGLVSYQLAVVVDDAAMGITDVLRGIDLLDSTPRQMALFRALGWRVPQFAHVPLLLGPDGKRLAKRNCALSLASLRQSGVQSERVIGELAHLAGLIPSPEPVKPRDLMAGFDLSQVPRHPLTLPTEFLGTWRWVN